MTMVVSRVYILKIVMYHVYCIGEKGGERGYGV